MKRVFIVLMILGLALSAAFAQSETQIFKVTDGSKEIVWQLTTRYRYDSFSNDPGPDGATTIYEQYYYNYHSPSRLDSLQTSIGSVDAGYDTDRYYYIYTDTEDYYQVDCLEFTDGHIPGGKTVKRYTYDDLLIYYAAYTSQDPGAAISTLDEYHYDENGNLLSYITSWGDLTFGPITIEQYSYDEANQKLCRILYGVNNYDLQNLTFLKGEYWAYNENGLITQDVTHVGQGSNPYMKILNIYDDNGLLVEDNTYYASDSLNWSIQSRNLTTYSMSYGVMKRSHKDHYMLNSQDSLSLLAVTNYTYASNNLDIHEDYHTLYGVPWEETTGATHTIYNTANLLLSSNRYLTNNSTMQGYQSIVTQTWNCVDTAVDDPVQTPNTIRLTSYPNPFNPSTIISYELPAPGNTVLELFNIRGQKVRTLFGGQQEAGQHSLTLEADSNTMASGVYFLRLTSGSKTGNTKLLLMK